jgi:hypothetical protein
MSITQQLNELESRVLTVENQVGKHREELAVLRVKMNLIAWAAGFGATVGVSTFIAVIFGVHI